MNYSIENIKEFILKFLDKEAECWTKRQLIDLDDYNQSIKALYAMAIDDLDEGLGIYYKKELVLDDNPVTYKPRHLFKLSSYQNKIYGDIWVAYVSITNPRNEINTSRIVDGFIISEIDNEFKIIGIMEVKLSRSTMAVMGWTGSVYNPSDLDIKKLGKFVATERYSEPNSQDNFSLKEYLKDK
ncbi:hypothetical protein E6C50_03000 [Flavobacterium supellecticarium]|uniref:Uncharacterized protein n=1 Tax=Flavobacterium supellecticarium TaxID=2565924 RepID=A0A4V3W8Z3_9FLAO|nr:hypothetical protein [Flavobacterium supellecticarium]THF53186.1 hypothetical protein E6C50_03000 [Flavobacterium supellecticarium]